MKRTAILLLSLLCTGFLFAQQANPRTYLNDTKAELNKKWPKNRTVNIVYHGHSMVADLIFEWFAKKEVIRIVER